MCSERQFLENQVLTLMGGVARTYPFKGDLYGLLQIFYNDILQRNRLPLGKTVIKINFDRLRRGAGIGDVEFITRVDDPYELNDEFQNKDLLLCYAIKTRHEGTFEQLKDTVSALEDYMDSNGFRAITDIYGLMLKAPENSGDNNVMLDLYIGVDPNFI